MKKRYQLLLIAVLTVFAYSNTFVNSFAMDDPTFIVNFEDAHSLQNIGKFFQGAVPRGHEGVYRPLRSVFYAISYQLWGTNVFGYHLQALVVHLACTVLVYFIANSLWRIAYSKKPNHNPFAISYMPFIAALLFGLHPIHTEAVTFMTASFDTIGVFFCFTSFYLYLKTYSVKKVSRSLKNVLSICFALLAYFTYEMTLVLPLLLVLYEVTLGKLGRMGKLGELGKRVGPYFLGVILYFLAKLMLTHSVARGAYMGGSMYYTFLVMTKAFLMYLFLLIAPVWLNLVHVLPGNIPTLGVADLKVSLLEKQSLWDPWVWLGILGLLGMLGAIWVTRKKTPLVSFGLGWILISLLPVSQIIPLQIVMAERYLYIPSVGFCILIAIVIFNLKFLIYNQFLKLKNYNLISNFPTLLFVTLVVIYSVLTFSRNREWFDDLTLWQSAVMKAPESASAHNNLALQYSQVGNIALAEKEYTETLKIDPDYNVALNNLGFLYLNTDRLDFAESLFKRALNSNPNFYPMLYGLSLVYEKEGKMDLAKEYMERAIKSNPNLKIQ